jgi:dihydropteroate synthase
MKVASTSNFSLRMTGDEFGHWLLSGDEKDRRPLVMGVLNVTPDSFSDGGLHYGVEEATRAGLQMLADGADIIDIGGESTRPGSSPVDSQEQIRRTIPVIAALLKHSPEAVVSIDTTRSMVAREAIDAGATIVNDTSGGLDDPAILSVAAHARCPIVLMHRQGTPLTMQHAPRYDDVVADVTTELISLRDAAISAGIAPSRIVLDVGIGFGKTTAHNLALLQHHDRFKAIGHALLLGASRKRFVGEITKAEDASERLAGSMACALWGVSHGADIVRVHDVKQTVQAVAMWRAIQSSI